MSYVCVHGHFYQPPRENPWLEEVELQDSAYPYHDWNERVTEECYAANASARILDDEGLIVKIVNNYSRISFDFGPTLLAWMERRRPGIYRAVLDADAQSRERFGGHGSALAQPYNHLIQPLASSRDKQTQVRWGIRDFRHRFLRDPEGIWLPETAVDLETLDFAAAEGIRFTVLAPHQASRVRSADDGPWTRVSADNPVDTTRPYRVTLPTGRSIAVFFYDGPISKGVAFENLLQSGAAFADRLVEPLRRSEDTRLVNIATDGETYGHHRRHGDMALAYALDAIENREAAGLINYAAYLERFPPRHQAEIEEDTSWSCSHGIERWHRDCGCQTGGQPGWNQSWRRPLREALDWLRDTVGPLWEEAASAHLRDPWAARDDYIDVVLERSDEALASFLGRHAAGETSDEELVEILNLMELQRHAMLMYTSCGWFFTDLSGIETVQVLGYAGRVLQLARPWAGPGLEAGFLERLARARSNVAEEGNGADIFERRVRPSMVDLPKVAAHYAISSVFNGYDESSEIYCYRVDRIRYRRTTAGRARLALGSCQVTSEITRATDEYTFGVLHFGDHNLLATVIDRIEPDPFEQLADDAVASFEGGDFPGCLAAMERHLGEASYSIRSLFRDQQRKILESILDHALGEVESSARHLYEHHAPLLRFLDDAEHPFSRALQAAAGFTLNTDLRRALDPAGVDLDGAEELLGKAERWHVGLDERAAAFAFENAATSLAESLLENPEEREHMERLERLVQLARSSPVDVNLWRVQNICYLLLERALSGHLEDAAAGEPNARSWVESFQSLAETLSIRVPDDV